MSPINEELKCQTLIAAVLATGVLAFPSFAQNGRPGPAEPISQGQNQGGDNRTNANNQSSGPTRVGPAGEGKVVLAFNDVSFEETIPLIAQATGKVVMPVNLAALKTKKITLIHDEPVDRSEALDLVLTALRLNGVGIIETEKVVILDLIENINTRQPEVVTADQGIMDRIDLGAYIVKIYRLTEASADGVGERIADNLPDYATLQVDANSNQILLHGDVGLARHVQKLIDELDRNYIEVETRTFRLAYADANEIAEQILELFEDTGTAANPQQQRGNIRQPQRTTRGQPTAAQTTTSPLTGPGPTVELRVSVNVKQNSLTISAEPIKVEAIGKLIDEEWDRPRQEETAKIYVLEHTDPLKVRDLLQSLLGQGGGVSSGGRRTTSTQRGGQAQIGGGGSTGVSESIGDIYTIEAYPDANTVVVISKTKESLSYLDSLIAAIDQPSTVGLPLVLELKHAEAISLAQELNVLLAETGSGITIEAPERGLTAADPFGGFSDQTQGGTGGLNAGRNQQTTGGGQAAGRLEFPWQRGAPRDDQSPETSLIGKVRIVPIVRQNALAVLAPPPYRSAIAQLIRDFDRPGRQVMVSAIIAEIELTNDLALGLRFSSSEIVPAQTDNAVGLSGSFLGTRDADLFSDLFNSAVLDVDANINVLLQALRQKTNVRILQEPRVFTADNQEAIFFDGQQVPFVSQSQTISTGGLTQSFDYVAVGVQLDVRPRITAERDVDMEINLVLSSVVPGETLFGGFILDQRSTTTKVIVKNGQTIVLSGILTDTESEVTRGLPLLSELPIIGDVFKSRDNSKVKTELVAFITPIVVDNPSENDYNFNEGARRRLEELAKPLKEQLKNKDGLSERIVQPVRDFQPNRPRPELDDETPSSSSGETVDPSLMDASDEVRSSDPPVDIDDLANATSPN